MASFVTGYSGGLGVTLPLSAIQNDIHLTILELFAYPFFAGFVASLPQVGKILNELSEMDGNE